MATLCLETDTELVAVAEAVKIVTGFIHEAAARVVLSGLISVGGVKRMNIAQAVADSIIKANTIDSTDDDGNPIEIPQEVVDLAESVAECIKKAYSSGSLSAIKDCKI